jgi:hypothetical protein
VIDWLMPFAKFVDKTKSFWFVFRLALSLAAIMLGSFAVLRLIYGRDAATALIDSLITFVGMIWELVLLHFQILLLLTIAVQMALFVPTMLVIALAHLLSRRYTGVVVKVISSVLFVIGTFFGVLAS